MADKDKGRIAFKLGSTVPAASAAPPSSSLGKRRRNGAFATDHDSDTDDDERPVRHESITGFGASGAETKKSPERSQSPKPDRVIIPSQPTRDWRDEHKARRQSRNPLPREADADKTRRAGAVDREPADDDKDVRWGLTVRGKKRVVGEKNGDDDDGDDVEAARPNDQNPTRTADEIARDAAYRRDLVSIGAPSTLKDYEAMPVEEFGAALLRGMGWDGVMRGPKPTEIRHRHNRLGLGAAKPENLDGLDSASADKKKRPRLDKYRMEESRRKESRRHEDSFKRERDRERERYRDGVRRTTSDRDRHRH
ncbi:hypothetical protein CP533_3051 [Ophiocordyceps camponoti-saundersi (nom. inval.)]|nr:hypothetical protein CP533_3051 [Ophiocordyceps camponoti-saundersi (nom. inval.)]